MEKMQITAKNHEGGSHVVLLWIEGTAVTYTKCRDGGSHTVLFWLERPDVIYTENHEEGSHIVVLMDRWDSCYFGSMGRM